MSETDWALQLAYKQIRAELRDFADEVSQAQAEGEALADEEFDRITKTILYLVGVEEVTQND